MMENCVIHLAFRILLRRIGRYVGVIFCVKCKLPMLVYMFVQMAMVFKSRSSCDNY